MEEDVKAVLEYVQTVSGNTWVYGAEGHPKYSIKADISIKVNDQAMENTFSYRNNWGLPAPKGYGKKDYVWVVSGAVVA